MNTFTALATLFLATLTCSTPLAPSCHSSLDLVPVAFDEAVIRLHDDMLLCPKSPLLVDGFSLRCNILDATSVEFKVNNRTFANHTLRRPYTLVGDQYGFIDPWTPYPTGNTTIMCLGDNSVQLEVNIRFVVDDKNSMSAMKSYHHNISTPMHSRVNDSITSSNLPDFRLLPFSSDQSIGQLYIVEVGNLYPIPIYEDDVYCPKAFPRGFSILCDIPNATTVKFGAYSTSVNFKEEHVAYNKPFLLRGYNDSGIISWNNVPHTAITLSCTGDNMKKVAINFHFWCDVYTFKEYVLGEPTAIPIPEAEITDASPEPSVAA